MSPPELSIIIVNYNLSEEVALCISSLATHLPSASYEVIVVDNASDDTQQELLRAQPDTNAKIKIIWNDVNHGFGKACNIGFDWSVGEFVCFLNPDTMVSSNIFAPLVAMASEENIAIVGPGFENRRWLFDFSAGFQPNLMLEALNVVLIGRYFEAFLIAVRTHLAREASIGVGWVLGACFLMRRNRFEELNRFDPEYFLFFEEVDLCRRALTRGYRVLYVPSVRLFHAGSTSMRRDYQAFTRHFYESKLRFVEKNFSGHKRMLLKRLVKLQLAVQAGLWRIMLLLKKDHDKARQKLQGIQMVLNK